MAKKNRIVLSYTKREWILIEKAIKNAGNKNGVISYIIKEANKLDFDCNDINENNKRELTKIEKRQFYPPYEYIESLDKLSDKLNLPRSTIVSRLIINPLLNEKELP